MCTQAYASLVRVGGMYVGVSEGGREEGERRERGRRRSGALLGRALQLSCVVCHIAQVLVDELVSGQRWAIEGRAHQLLLSTIGCVL